MTFWIVTGPTASGKSGYALQMARHLNSEIINADSLQIYRDLRILTARPTLTQEQKVPHHGYGFLDSDVRFSVGKWLAWATVKINEIQNRGKTAIVVGGTGLYLKALQNGLTTVPDIDPAIRIGLQQQLNSHGLSRLYVDLCAQDPQSAQKISPKDTQRILRALEVVSATGHPISYWQAQPVLFEPQPHRAIVILPDKETVKKQASIRIQEMIKQGAVNEVKALLECGIPETAPIFQALGARSICRYLQEKNANEDKLQITLQNETNQYIKRQYTWLRHQFKSDLVLDSISPNFDTDHLTNLNTLSL